MNIISNKCVGARLYQLLGIPYNNPFMWCRIYYPSYRKIVVGFRDMDLFDYEVSVASFPGKKIGKVTLSGGIEVFFPHYVQNSKCSEPTVKDIDVWYNDAAGYTEEKWLSRAERVVYGDEIYVLYDDESLGMTPDDINDFMGIGGDCVKIVVTRKECDFDVRENCSVIRTSETNTKKIAGIILDKCGGVFRDA